MIFCTVGTQQPFDRLINYVIEWQKTNLDVDVVFQVGSSKKYLPDQGYHMTISEPLFSSRFSEAEFIISHAGMGNIIRAIETNKAIVVVARKASLGEHINNHQLDTIDSLANLPNLFIANDYETFCSAVSCALKYNPEDLNANKNLLQLISSVSNFIEI